MNKLLFKWLSSVAVLIINVVFSSLPVFVHNSTWVGRAESLAGGIFIGAAVVHLFPEAVEGFSAYEYPIYAYVALGSFFMMLSLEYFATAHHSAHDHQFEVENPTETDRDGIFGTKDNKISFSSWLLLFVLSFHGFVEAVALGIAQDEASLWALFLVIIGHKPVEAFALGLHVIRSRPTKLKYFILLILFSFISPITTISFMYIGQSAPDLFSAIVTAFSTGVFFYVGFHELSEKVHIARHIPLFAKLWDLGMIFLGFLWMSLFSLIGHGHSHDHDHLKRVL